MPRQRRTPLAEHAKVDLRPHVDGDDVQEAEPGPGRYAAHFLVVGGPFRARCFFEDARVAEDGRPVLVAVLEEERCVEGDAAVDGGGGGRAVLVADLRWGVRWVGRGGMGMCVGGGRRGGGLLRCGCVCK